MKVRSWKNKWNIYTLRPYGVGKMNKSDGIMGKALK